jgi:ribosomal protein S18 acetylase RimI-like enzyme
MEGDLKGAHMSGEQRTSTAAADLLHGHVRVEQTGEGWVRPWRVTALQERVLSSAGAWHPGEYRQMGMCTSGIFLEMDTNATTLELEVRVDPLPHPTEAVLGYAGIPRDALVDGFSCDVEGRHLPVRMPPVGEGVVRFVLDDPKRRTGTQQELPGLGALRRVRVWLPMLRGCELRALLADGEVRPVAAHQSLLVIGDSLAQGFLVGDPAFAFPALMGRRLHCDVINQGIGGQVFQPGFVANLPTVVRDPRCIVVELGGNYRYEPCSRLQVEREVRQTIADVSRGWPETRVWVMTPTFHNEAAWPTHPRSCFWELYDICRRAVRGNPLLHLVDGIDLMDADLGLLVDEGHPRAEGSEQIAARLANVIDHRRMRPELLSEPDDAADDSAQKAAHELALRLLEDAPADLAGMRETLRRGLGEVIAAEPGVVALRLPDDDWMLWAPDLEQGRRFVREVMAGWEPQAALATVFQPELVPTIRDTLGLDACQRFDLVAPSPDVPWPSDRDIRPLDASYLDVVMDAYEWSGDYSRRAMRSFLEDGLILGGFESDGELAGFVGEHPEGAIGMLEVLPGHRRRGWGAALEQAKAADQRRRGLNPWGQVFPENDASLALQRSLGISPAGHGYYLFAKETGHGEDVSRTPDTDAREGAQDARNPMTKSVFGRGHELELEFNEICRELGGDVESRRKADEYLGTTGALYHGGPISWAMTPKIFTKREAAALADIAETCGRIMDKLTRAFLEDPSFRSRFRLSPEMERLCLTQAGYERLIPIMRADIFLNEETGDFQFCEINTDGSAGMSDAVEVTNAIRMTETYRAFERRHPSISTFDVERTACDAILACYATWDKAGREGHPRERPCVVFVDYGESASTDEVESLCRRYAEQGIAARFADIRDLRIEDVDGHERLCDGVGPIDCVWRRAVTGEILDKPCDGATALIEAGRRDLCCIVGSFRTWPVATKTVFAVLWEDGIEKVLDAEELAFVRTHVPETIVLAPDSDLAPYADKDAWILKPSGGYNSMGVLSGLEATSEQWADALAATAEGGGVIQRYATQYATPMVIGGRLPDGAGYTDMAAREADRIAHALDFSPANNMEGLYLFNGRFSGIYTRCGYQATIGEWTNRFHMGCLVVDE